jgi:hypothetical protein
MGEARRRLEKRGERVSSADPHGYDGEQRGSDHPVPSSSQRDTFDHTIR